VTSTANLRFLIVAIFLSFLTSLNAQSGNDILSISEFQIYRGDIDSENHRVILLVPHNKDLTSMRPAITVSDGATISPESGTERDFTISQVYVVTSANGQDQEWTISAMTLPPAETPFIMTMETSPDDINGTPEIIIPATEPGHQYFIDWGDGTTGVGVGWNNHIYDAPGVYTIKITGHFPRIVFTGRSVAKQLLTIEQWGDNPWVSMSQAFEDCSNLRINATDAPNLSYVKDMSFMFNDASLVDLDMSHWDVNNVKFMWAILDNTSYSVENYDKTLQGWSQQTLQPGVNFGANRAQYCEGEIARQSIVDSFGWTFRDDGLFCPNETDIESFFLEDQIENAVIDALDHKITMEVVYNSDITSLAPDINVSTYATISPESGIAVDFSVPVTYTVTSRDGTLMQDWTVEVNLGPEPGTDILSFSFLNEEQPAIIDAENHTITAFMPPNRDITILAPRITVSEGATISPNPEERMDFSSPIIYTVTSSDGLITQEWMVTVEVGIILSLTQTQDLSIFPNPTSGILNIQQPGQNKLNEVLIFDSTGKKWLQATITPDRHKLDLNNLPAGLYWIRLRNGETVKSRSFIKR
jgi:hypothetical protein